MQTTIQEKTRNKQILELVIAGCDIIEKEGACLQCVECDYKPPQQKYNVQKKEEIKYG